MSPKPKENGVSRSLADVRRQYTSLPGPAVRFSVHAFISLIAVCLLIFTLAVSPRPAAADPGLTLVAPAEEQINRDPAERRKPKKKKTAVKKEDDKTESEKTETGAKASKTEHGVKDDKTKDLSKIGGIFYGEIASVDPEHSSIFVLPINKHYPRKIFYVDKFTDYFTDGEPDELDSLRLRQRVAVRYFGDLSVRVAEAVYVVSQEFNPEDYKPVKKKKGKEKAEKGKSSKDKSSKDSAKTAGSKEKDKKKEKSSDEEE